MLLSEKPWESIDSKSISSFKSLNIQRISISPFDIVVCSVFPLSILKLVWLVDSVLELLVDGF